MRVGNYVETRNPFGLAAPPAWFLLTLAVEDPALRIFPSEEQPCYRVGRRAPSGRRMQILVTRGPDGSVVPNKDSQTMHRLRLVPVTSIRPSPEWGGVLLYFQEHDGHRVGSAADVVRRIEGHEEAQDAALARADASELDALNSYAYHVAKRQVGQRIGMNSRGPAIWGDGLAPPPRPKRQRPRLAGWAA